MATNSLTVLGMVGAKGMEQAQKIDVYALGILMAAILMQGEPFPVSMTSQDLLYRTATDRAFKPEVPPLPWLTSSEGGHLYQTTMQKCWARHPNDRILVQEVAKELGCYRNRVSSDHVEQHGKGEGGTWQSEHN